MLVTKEVFRRLQIGDYVRVKTLGQLIDSGWYEQYGVLFHDNGVAGVTPQMLSNGELRKIKSVGFNQYTEEYYITLEDDELEWKYTIEMLHELYPLARGLV